MSNVYDFRAGSRIPLDDRRQRPSIPAPSGLRKIPQTTLELVATLLDEAQGRTLHEREVRKAKSLLLAPNHPSHRRRI